MRHPRAMAFAAVTAAASYLLFSIYSKRNSSDTRAEREKSITASFILIVHVTFSNKKVKEDFKIMYAEEAEFCRKNEPNTLSYELALSDRDELSGVIIERFQSKDDYLLHKESSVFKRYREKLKKLEESGDVKLNGQSYYQSNLGYF
eukprot:760467-Hanusia_phi.AAC.7